MSVIGQRVTQRSQSQATMRGLEVSLNRAQKLQEQLSSGKLVGRPSDDPSAAVSSMKLRSMKATDEQFLRNIGDAQGRMAVTDTALTDISSQIRKSQELMIAARNGSTSPASRDAIAAELDQVRGGVIDTYNTRWLDRPVFAGTAPGTTAVDSTGNYVGNDKIVESRVSRNVVLRTDTTGSEAAADELPGLLADAAETIRTGGDVGPALDQIDKVLSKVLTALGDIGARANQLDKAAAAVESEKLDFTARISENEDVDLPKTIMELTSAQASYEAALGAAAKVMQTSLLDFLR